MTSIEDALQAHGTITLRYVSHTGQYQATWLRTTRGNGPADHHARGKTVAEAIHRLHRFISRVEQEVPR